MASKAVGEIKNAVKKKLVGTKPFEVANILKKHKRRNNFYDLALRFDNLGVGLRFIRKIWWNKPETYWTITRVEPGTNNPLTRSGRAWGLFTWRGKTEEKEREVRCTLKREWRYVDPSKSIVHWPMWNRKELDMNHPQYPSHLKEKYFNVVD